MLRIGRSCNERFSWRRPNNDGLDDTTGKNIFGGTNKKMTDEEREELDQEIMDLLNEEDQEKSMSNALKPVATLQRQHTRFRNETKQVGKAQKRR